MMHRSTNIKASVILYKPYATSKQQGDMTFPA